MSRNAKALRDWLCRWRDWSETADQSEEGWQSTYPQWDQLYQSAVTLMVQPDLAPEEIELLATCWAMSDEDEDFADYAKSHLEECLPAVICLADSPQPTTRWQVFEVLGCAGGKGEQILRRGLKDPDAYCRRRALGSLARLRISDLADVAASFAEDPDPYMQILVKEIADESRKL